MNRGGKSARDCKKKSFSEPSEAFAMSIPVSERVQADQARRVQDLILVEPCAGMTPHDVEAGAAIRAV